MFCQFFLSALASKTRRIARSLLPKKSEAGCQNRCKLHPDCTQTVLCV
jgi:hypothetical protein